MDQSTLQEYALKGLIAERDRINLAIAELQASTNGDLTVEGKKRVMSAAGRKAISRAMKARWRAHAAQKEKK